MIDLWMFIGACLVSASIGGLGCAFIAHTSGYSDGYKDGHKAGVNHDA